MTEERKEKGGRKDRGKEFDGVSGCAWGVLEGKSSYHLASYNLATLAHLPFGCVLGCRHAS